MKSYFGIVFKITLFLSMDNNPLRFCVRLIVVIFHVRSNCSIKQTNQKVFNDMFTEIISAPSLRKLGNLKRLSGYLLNNVWRWHGANYFYGYWGTGIYNSKFSWPITYFHIGHFFENTSYNHLRVLTYFKGKDLLISTLLRFTWELYCLGTPRLCLHLILCLCNYY